MLAFSDLRIDPRVERAARTMVQAGYQVTVVWPDAYPPYYRERPLDWGMGVSFHPLPARSAGAVMAFPWLTDRDMLAVASSSRPFAIHCHDLPTAVIGLSAARRTGAFCICDFHEWYSENVSWSTKRRSWVPHPWFKRWFLRVAERLVLWRADAVITVCDSIANDLSTEFSRRPRAIHVIRNIPKLNRSAKPYPPLRQQLGLAAGQFLLLWQGGTGPSRMIEPIIRALAQSPHVTFVIRGPSLDLFGDGYRELARQVGVADRLILLPPVPSGDVVTAAVGADAGIWTLPNLCKNFYYALPNKIFEYMAAGLPVLAADFPEARKMVEGHGVGLCFDPYDPGSIARQLNRLVEEPGLVERLRAAIPTAMRTIDADREWEKLADLYRGLEFGGRARETVVDAAS